MVIEFVTSQRYKSHELAQASLLWGTVAQLNNVANGPLVCWNSLMVGNPWPMGDSHRYTYKGANPWFVMMIIVLGRHVSMCYKVHDNAQTYHWCLLWLFFIISKFYSNRLMKNFMRMPLAHLAVVEAVVGSPNYQKEQHEKQTVAIIDDVPLPLPICVYVLFFVDLVLVKVDHLFRFPFICT